MSTSDSTPQGAVEGRPPEVTVAIIFYNAMPHFKAALASVLMQTFADWELLLVDDGSTDGSLEFARSVRDPRVRVFSDGFNLKLNVRLNQSIAHARGRYYFRMDADDMMFPHRIERQLSALRDGDNRTVVGARAVCINQQNTIIGLRAANESLRNVRDARHAFIHPTVCASTEWFRRNKYSEEFLFHRSQDAELWTRTWAGSRFVHLAEPLLFYRENETIQVENYIGSALGMCMIAYRQYSLRAHSRLLWIGSELLRCWGVCVYATMGIGHRIVRRRNRSIEPSDAAKFEEIKTRIMTNTPTPAAESALAPR